MAVFRFVSGVRDTHTHTVYTAFVMSDATSRQTAGTAGDSLYLLFCPSPGSGCDFLL